MARIKIKTEDGVKELILPAKDHLEAQIKYPSRTFRNKKKYTRKKKHKKKDEQEP